MYRPHEIIVRLALELFKKLYTNFTYWKRDLISYTIYSQFIVVIYLFIIRHTIECVILEKVPWLFDPTRFSPYTYIWITLKHTDIKMCWWPTRCTILIINFLFHSFLSALHVSNESIRSSSGARHNILCNTVYYAVLLVMND